MSRTSVVVLTIARLGIFFIWSDMVTDLSFMYRLYVGHVLSAIEKSDLDQVFIRKTLY